MCVLLLSSLTEEEVRPAVLQFRGAADRYILLTYIHTYIHLTYIYKCIHKYTYHRYTYTHTHLYNFIYFFFSMNFFSSAAMEERFTSRQCQIVPVQKIRKVSFFLVFYLSCIHTYIQHKCIYTFSTHTYMLPAHIRTSSTQTYIYPVHRHTFYFFQPYTMRFSSEENGLK